MALLFPFDTTLKGRVEIVEINIGELQFPMFVFPKGSFFVSELYGFIKGTRTMVRPGLDYKVISLNETIPFTDVAEMDRVLKENYVRNAVLWIGDPDAVIMWSVPYSGGEDEVQPAIYRNYIAELYNQAMSQGTVNLFLTPNQAFAGFASVDNTQISDGRNIYSKEFDYNVNELGWGKVQSAITSLADVLASGGDPLEIQAFHDWVRKQEEVFNGYKNPIIEYLDQQIEDLENIRVDEGQFIFAGDNKPTGNFVEHYGTILRGLDPTEPAPVFTPLGNKGNQIGYYGLAGGGYDIGSRAARLYQKLNDNADNDPFRVKVKFEGQGGVTNNNQYRVSVEFINKAKAKPNGNYQLYIASREIKDIISTINLNGHIASSNNEVTLTVNYPNIATDYPEDVLFGYVAEVNSGSTDYHIPDRYRYLSKRRKAGYGITVVNNGLLFTDERILSKNATLDENNNAVGTGSIEVIVTRQFADVAETTYLTVTPLTSTVINPMRTLQWDVGEQKKRITISPNNSAAFIYSTSLVIQNRTTDNGTLTDGASLAEVLVGYLKTTGGNDGYIQLTTMDGSPIMSPEVSEGVNYKLVVKFSKNVIVHVVKSKPRIDLFSLVGGVTATDVRNLILMSEPNYLNNSTIEYVVSFKNLDSVGSSVMMLELKDGNNLRTNVLNLLVNDPVASAPVLGSIASSSVAGSVNADGGLDVEYTVVLDSDTIDRSIGISATINSPSNLEITTPPRFIKANTISFKATIPVMDGPVDSNIDLRYLTPTGSVLIGNISKTLSVPKPHDIVIINKRGEIIQNAILNEPFRLVYVNQSGRIIYHISTVKNDLPSSSLEVKFGGDAVNNIFLKGGNVPVGGATTTISVDNWITVTEISPARVPQTVDSIFGLIDLKATITFTDNTTQIIDVPIRVFDNRYNVRFYSLDGGELPRKIPVRTDILVTISSALEDLRGYGRAEPTTNSFIASTVRYDQYTNTINLRFNGTSNLFDGDFGFKLFKSGGAYNIPFEAIRKITTYVPEGD